jgi:signal transduction histidine kinase
VVADAVTRHRVALLPLAAALLLLAAWRRAPRALVLLTAALVLVDVGAHVHLRVERTQWSQRSEARVAGELARLERRKSELVGLLQGAATRVASLPEAHGSLSGDRAALDRLFASLETLHDDLPQQPALAVQALPLRTLAWSSRASDPMVLQGFVGNRPDVFIIEGNVTTTLVGTAPIVGAGGQVQGVATAALPLAVRRNIRTEYLRDFDLLTGGKPGVEIEYVDAQVGPQSPAFPPAPPGTMAREAVLRDTDGDALAAVRVTAPTSTQVQATLVATYRRMLSLLAVLAIIAWGGTAARPAPALRVLLAAVAARTVLALLGPPLPGPDAVLLSADAYASAVLGPLLRSPLDLLLTVTTVVLAAMLLLSWSLRRPPLRPFPLSLAAAAIAGYAAVAGAFAFVADTVANCALDVEAIPLIPRSPAHLVIQVSLVLVLAAAMMIVTASFALVARPGAGGRARDALVAVAIVALLAWRLRPPALGPVPIACALALLAGGALVGARREWWRRWLSARPIEAGAALAVLAVSALTLDLYPALVALEARNTRQQVERNYAPAVLRQAPWRQYVLQGTERQIDAMNVLEEAPPGPTPPGVEELAFAVWSHTDLAAFGLSSAVEIQDPSGAVISRFALNLPSLPGPPKALPPTDDWEEGTEVMTFASTEHMVRRARRRLAYHGQVHGGIQVDVGDDFWNLRFLRSNDPYSVLFRAPAQGAIRDRAVTLIAYDALTREVVFSSASRPPVIDPAAVLARLGRGSGETSEGTSSWGLWTSLDIDDIPHHAYVFAGDRDVYALAFPAATAGSFAADLLEAVSGLTLVALAALLLLALVRTALRKPRLSLPSITREVTRRFSLRLFVAFIAVAVVALVVLQVAVRNFVSDRLRREAAADALDRAAFAKKIVDDYAYYKQPETEGQKPVTDEALVWVASIIRNDLDLFERGRLLASSKRELYSSGLLAPRVSGPVYRSLVLEGQPSVLRSERIGDFSYDVASVPAHLDAAEPGILSIPLALRQRDVEAALEDLDRTMRLASVVFLALAAVVARSMARRISGPISDLTQATLRVAEGDLHTRVETTSQDELRRLVEAFNKMARDLDLQRRDLERSNRLAAWAEMARQVAHEVKNPLTPIQLSAEHLRRVWNDRSEDFAATLETCTQTILKQVRILRSMVTEFSAFARPPAPELESHDLAPILAEVVQPYESALPPAVALSLEIEPGVPRVRADRRLLERGVVNLLENALQAVGERGWIRVGLRSDGARRVIIEVRDSGPGVDPEVRDRIFEPFFSTKTSGSGLGLALVKKIAEDHGGGVALESGGREGTRAILWLPAEENGGQALAL